MAQSTINNNSVQPLGLPNTGVGTDEGDLWNAAVVKLNAMLTELYNRTGGTGTLANNQPNPLANFRNVVDGGDATIAPFQRGTSFTSIGAAVTYTADRWFMRGNAGTSGTMAQSADTAVVGFSKSFKWGRGQSAGAVSTLFVGQALESNDSIRLQGQNVVFSFWARGDAGFLSGNTSGNLLVQIVQGFGTDQGASALINNTWTSQANVFSGQQALSTAVQRFSFSGLVSSTATQLGVLLSYTPNVTTAMTAENVIMNGLQLEVSTVGASVFEFRDVEVELALCQRYAYVVNEPASGVFVGIGTVGPANSGNFVVTMPTPMRAAPTVTVNNGSFGALVIGGYVALSAMSPSATHTPNYIGILGLATMVSGQAVNLIGGGGTGKITASADL